jgi:RimJ/RimL family protein N-acetyltransferase
MLCAFRNISLRQVVEDDLAFLFRLFADPGRCYLWMRCRRVYDERGFHQAWSAWTTESMAAKFIIEAAGQPVGLVFDYDRAAEDGYTKVTTLLEEGSVGHGAGVIATALFVTWLFQNLPLRKVQMEVYGYNPAVLRMLHKVGFNDDGVLKGIRFWDGVYWDLHVLALYRENWPAIRDRLFRLRRAARQQTAAISPARETQALASRVPLNGCLNRAE